MTISGADAPATDTGETTATVDANESATFDDYNEELYSGSATESLDTAGRDEVAPLEDQIDGNEAEEEASSEEVGGEPEVDAGEDGEGEVGEEELRKLAATLGEDSFEVPLEAEIEVKIDGKVEKMTLQEAVNKASGTEAVERRFSALDKERKEFEFIKKTLNEHAGKIQSASKAGNHEEVMELVAQMGGLDPVEFQESIDRLVFSRNQEILGISDEDIEALVKQRSVDYLSGYRERQAAAKQEATKHLTDSEPQFRQLQQTFSQAGYSGISDQVVSQALQGLNQERPGEKHTYVDALEVAILSEEYTQIGEVFKETNPDLVNNVEALKTMQGVVRMFVQLEGRKPSNEELQEVAREVYGTSTEQEKEVKPTEEEKPGRLSRKLSQSKSKQKKRTSSSSPLAALEEKFGNTDMMFSDFD